MHYSDSELVSSFHRPRHSWLSFFAVLFAFPKPRHASFSLAPNSTPGLILLQIWHLRHYHKVLVSQTFQTLHAAQEGFDAISWTQEQLAEKKVAVSVWVREMRDAVDRILKGHERVLGEDGHPRKRILLVRHVSRRNIPIYVYRGLTAISPWRYKGVFGPYLILGDFIVWKFLC